MNSVKNKAKLFFLNISKMSKAKNLYSFGLGRVALLGNSFPKKYVDHTVNFECCPFFMVILSF
ncbi:hypothetical protein C0971_10520 [Bacillus methanolicus]|nr:hypothetical protein C0971_10520 [Bacillus methanolicus]